MKIQSSRDVLSTNEKSFKSFIPRDSHGRLTTVTLSAVWNISPQAANGKQLRNIKSGKAGGGRAAEDERLHRRL